MHLTQAEAESLWKVVEMYTRDEKNHYLESERKDRKGHIYLDLKVLAAALKRGGMA